MDERLEFYLKRHKDACGCVDLKLSHQEITELNTSREVISRLLKKIRTTWCTKIVIVITSNFKINTYFIKVEI
jgi:CRP/FNR family transcriptional regulator